MLTFPKAGDKLAEVQNQLSHLWFLTELPYIKIVAYEIVYALAVRQNYATFCLATFAVRPPFHGQNLL